MVVDQIVNQVYISDMPDRSLLRRIYDAHRLLAAMEAEPRRYGTDRLFYASEIHTLVCIGENPNVNLTTLAARLEVSKSAASKFVAKLLQAGGNVLLLDEPTASLDAQNEAAVLAAVEWL